MFVNVAGLTKYQTAPGAGIPRSWSLTFTGGGDIVNVRCYLHGNEDGDPRLGSNVEAHLV